MIVAMLAIVAVPIITVVITAIIYLPLDVVVRLIIKKVFWGWKKVTRVYIRITLKGEC
jgi:hypothetical protein